MLAASFLGTVTASLSHANSMLMPRAFRACTNCGGEGGLYVRSNKRQGVAVRRVRRPCQNCSNNGLVEGPMPEPRLLPGAADRTHLGVVAIAGGGIGGAAAALALQQRGIPVMLYERDDNFQQRAQGYGLTMQQGATALMQLGIPNEGVFSHTHRSFLPDGTLLGEYGRAVHATTRDRRGNGKGADQRRNAHIPRQALRGRLLSALLPGTVQWGKAISRFDSDPGGVTLHFCDGSPPERASLLVGADGIRSTVRSQLLGHAPLRYLGVVVILGRAACAHPFADEQVFQTLDGATRIYVMPFSTSPPVAMCARRARTPAAGVTHRCPWDRLSPCVAMCARACLPTRACGRMLADAGRGDAGSQGRAATAGEPACLPGSPNLDSPLPAVTLRPNLDLPPDAPFPLGATRRWQLSFRVPESEAMAMDRTGSALREEVVRRCDVCNLSRAWAR